MRPERRQSIPYNPGLDGLRALAVGAVLLYHLELIWAPGGFLGVEVFFVISGYLISTLLLTEWIKSRSINLRAFWLHRARRLLPALFAVLAATAALTWALNPSLLDRLRSEVSAALGYVTNWFLVLRDLPYFEAFADPPPLQHLWSLAVEEQFYILWPLVVAALLLVVRARKTERAQATLAVAIGLMAVGSLALMWLLYDPLADTSRLYYGTDTRASGLLLGSALAFVWRPWEPNRGLGTRGRRLLDGLGLLAVGGLLALFGLVSEYGSFLYQGGFAVTGLTTALVIAAVVHPHSRLGRIIGWRPMRWLGTRSYSVYLWHWPLIVLGGPILAAQWGPVWAGMAAVALTFLLSELSFHLVESPFRRSAGTKRHRLIQPRWAGLAAATGAAVALAFSVPPGLIGQRTFVAWAAVSGISSSSASVSVGQPLEVGMMEPEMPPRPAAVLVIPDYVSPQSRTSPSSTSWDARLMAQALGLSWGQSEAQVEASKLTVLAIGDSVMAGAERRLSAHLGELATIDAEVNRQFTTGIHMLDRLRSRDELPQVVVVHLGTNSAINASYFQEMMGVLRDVPRVVLVTVRVPRRYEGTVNGILREGVNQWPNAVLADWHTVSDEEESFFVRDGVHLTAPGADAYVQLIRDAIYRGPAETPASAA